MVFTLEGGNMPTAINMGINRSEVIDVPYRPSNLMLHDFTENDSYGSYQSQSGTPATQGSSGEDVNNTTTSIRKRRKKRSSFIKAQKFSDLYVPTGELLGKGSQGSVNTYRNLLTNKEVAVKIIEKNENKSRSKVLKEIEIFHHCRGHANILQLIEYFEEEHCFYVIFEKMEGGSLFETIEYRGHLTEQEAIQVVRDISSALNFLHQKGIAHRDLKPDNILCTRPGHLTPVKICDFDLGSGIILNSRQASPVTTPKLQTPVGSAEFMAPEVVDVWQEMAWSYDKKCDLWSLGIILYIMLCGYPPFGVNCDKDCGWNRGINCDTCQSLLFARIQNGSFIFPEMEWGEISDEVKDLIRHLLVKDPHQRYCAGQVLQHPWLNQKSPNTALLVTPHVLLRNNSIKELQTFTGNAVAVNRMMLRHYSITEAREPLTTLRGVSESLKQLRFDDNNTAIFVNEEEPPSVALTPTSSDSGEVTPMNSDEDIVDYRKDEPMFSMDSEEEGCFSQHEVNINASNSRFWIRCNTSPLSVQSAVQSLKVKVREVEVTTCAIDTSMQHLSLTRVTSAIF